jgi:hypothetical protein
MDVAVSGDGRLFETVLSRRWQEDRDHPFWVNAHPQYVTDDDAILISLLGRRVAAVRITPVDSAGNWALAEILLHPSRAGALPEDWSEWLDPGLSWEGRVRALASSPIADRADWHYRVALSARAIRSRGSGPS